LMAKKNVILVPTDGDSVSFTKYARLAFPDNKEIITRIMQYRKMSADRLQRALKRGVTIAAGSDDYVDFKMPFAEPSKRTLMGYVESGISVSKVLQFATINASKQVRWSEKIGKIKKGFFADIVAVDNDIDKNMNAIMN